MYNLRSLLFVLLSSILLIACGNDDDEISVNLSEFEQITEPYPYDYLTTNSTIDYWELIYSQGFDEEEIVFTYGIKCQNATVPNDCIIQFDTTENDIGGFATGCLPSYCFHYIKYQVGDEISIITNTQELRAFLGEIDTESDAILLAISQNYRFNTEIKEIGSIKETSSGYQILMTKLVRDCSPIQVNRFLLEVTNSGVINILDEEKYSSSDGCI